MKISYKEYIITVVKLHGSWEGRYQWRVFKNDKETQLRGQDITQSQSVKEAKKHINLSTNL